MNETPRRSFNYYAMYFMTLFYLAAGVFLIAVERFEWLEETNRKIVGFILIAWGLFRMYVLKKRYGR